MNYKTSISGTLNTGQNLVNGTFKSFENPCAVAYLFGFNGKENDNEVKGTGNNVDFGARIYDPRLGRWLSVDPLFKEYIPISPYCFGLDNPIKFLDLDGNIIVDPDGNPITYNEKTGWSPNATEDVKRLCNPMLRTRSGQRALLKMQKASYPIYMNIDPGTNKNLAITTKTYLWNETDKTYSIQSMEITVFEGNFLEKKKKYLEGNYHATTYQGMLYEESIRRTGGIDEAMAASTVHEIDHATDPVNIKQAIYNIRLKTNYDIEAVPEKHETEFLLEIMPIEKMTPKKVESIPMPENNEPTK